MSHVVKWSVILTVLVAIVSIAFIAAGMHTNPITNLLFIPVAIVINVVVIVLALRATAGEQGYKLQLRDGFLIGVFAGVLITATSWITLSFVFPDAIAEMTAGAEELIRGSGLDDELVEAQVRALEGVTPFSQAWPGGLGTLFWSILTSAIGGIFIRRK